MIDCRVRFRFPGQNMASARTTRVPNIRKTGSIGLSRHVRERNAREGESEKLRALLNGYDALGV